MLCECVPQAGPGTRTGGRSAKKNGFATRKRPAPSEFWTHPYHFRAKRLQIRKLSLSLPRKESGNVFRHLLHPRIHCDGPKICVKLRHYKILHSVPAPVFSPNAPRYKLKFGVVPNVGFSRCIGSRGALFSPATFPSGVFIASEVTPSCKPTAGRASRLIRLDSDAASPMQSVSACGSAGSLSSHQTRISP